MSHFQPPVITIDGPTSSGKGTIGKLLADNLGWHFLDSGVLYRALALAALEKDIAKNNIAALEFLARNLQLSIRDEAYKEQNIVCEGRDITDAIRQEECGVRASEIAIIPEVRAAMAQRCRTFRQPPGLIADGRDMGTAIFPDAALKIFLTASVKVRADRRLLQLQKKGINVNLRDVVFDLEERDKRDSVRAIAPLKPAQDAKIVDATNLSIDEVLQFLLAVVNGVLVKREN